MSDLTETTTKLRDLEFNSTSTSLPDTDNIMSTPVAEVMTSSSNIDDGLSTPVMEGMTTSVVDKKEQHLTTEPAEIEDDLVEDSLIMENVTSSRSEFIGEVTEVIKLEIPTKSPFMETAATDMITMNDDEMESTTVVTHNDISLTHQPTSTQAESMETTTGGGQAVTSLPEVNAETTPRSSFVTTNSNEEEDERSAGIITTARPTSNLDSISTTSWEESIDNKVETVQNDKGDRQFGTTTDSSGLFGIMHLIEDALTTFSPEEVTTLMSEAGEEVMTTEAGVDEVITSADLVMMLSDNLLNVEQQVKVF